jgi:GT2 family glycosyltransferase
MKITVAICTLNRSRLLRQTLQSLSQIRLDVPHEWEILLVDNGSTDDTKQVVQSFADRLPLKYLFQPIVGHARSRNHAIENVSGDLIVWTDDDVKVQPNWLEIYANAASMYPQSTFFGGTISPYFEAPMPSWLGETWGKCSSAFATREQGDLETAIPPALFPFGANFAVRASVQQDFLFNVALGRQADGMLGEDEIDVFRRMVQAGHTGVWLPQARLEHVIPSDRATPDYVSQYFVGQGLANVLKGQPTFQSRFHALRVAVHQRACYWLKRNRVSADEWVSHMIRSSIAWGELRGWDHRAIKPLEGSSRS